MITQPTVLVLGAGASRPYGLQTAKELSNDVIFEHRNDTGQITKKLEECGCRRDDIRTFFREFTESGHYSLDAFVIRRPEFRQIVKLTLAFKLMISESDSTLSVQREEDDWHRFLFSRIMPKDADAFKANRLSVLTFNFDRSFERRFWRVLSANYGQQNATALLGVVPVLHLYGQLGALQNEQNEPGRPYAIEQDPASIVRYAEEIKLIDDEIDLHLFSRATDALKAAERICFIGFSFHEDNLNRLNARALADKALHGTCYQMSDADRGRVYRYINSPLTGYLHNCSARQFFDAVDLF